MNAKALSWLAAWLLALVAALRVVTLGLYPLTDTTEARYAEMARKMLDTGNWLTPMIDVGVPFWGKPPLSMWLSAAGQALVGVGEVGARLGPLWAALMVMALLCTWPQRGHRGQSGYITRDQASNTGFALNKSIANNDADIAKNGYSSVLGVVAALVFLSSPLGFIASGAVMTDMAMVAGTTLSMVAFWRAMGEQQSELPTARLGGIPAWWPYLFFVGQTIGLLAKGPVAMVLTGVALGGWLVVQSWRCGTVSTVAAVWRALPWLRGTLLLAALVLPWYALAEQATPGFLRYFLVGEHWQRFTQTGWKGDLYGVAHAQPKGRIWLFALLCTLPWLLAALWWAWTGRRRNIAHRDAGVATSADANETTDQTTYLLAWCLAPCVFFTLSGNILPAYVLPGLPAFALLTAGLARRGAPWLVGLCALATPVVFTVMVSAYPASLAAFSDRDLLSRPNTVYLFDRTDSGLFYTQGRAALAKTPEAIARAVGDAAHPSPYAQLLLPHVHVVRWQERLTQAGWVESGRNSLNVAYQRKMATP